MASAGHDAGFAEFTERNERGTGTPDNGLRTGFSEQKEYYRALFELDPTAVYSCDKNGVITSFNRRAAELWGRAPAPDDTDERFCGSYKLFRPDGTYMPHDQCPMADVVAGRMTECRDQEVLIERPNGSQVTVIVNIRPLTNWQGEIVGAINCFYDITARKRSEEALRQSHATLERKVLQRTAALRSLSSSLMRIQDDERHRISRELHDSVGQHLAIMKCNIERLAGEEASEEEAQKFAELLSSIDKCIAETRTISYLLHPPLLDELGLLSAVRWYVEGFSQRSGIQVNLDIPPNLQRLPDGLELVLFRVLQESLTNVHRHSRSRSVDVRLEAGENDVSLSVRDYGRGLTATLLEQVNAGMGGGVGLTSMRERIGEIGGKFEIESDSKGTLIRATVPLLPGGSTPN